MQIFIKTLSAFTAAALLSACGTALKIGGAPEVAKTNCVNAVARRFDMPPGAMVIVSSAATRDGLYEIRIDSRDGRRHARCEVDENGAVLGVLEAR